MTGNGNGHKPHPVKPRDYRCSNCGRLLFRAVLVAGSRVEIRCWHSSCKRTHVFASTGLAAPASVVELIAEGAIHEQQA